MTSHVHTTAVGATTLALAAALAGCGGPARTAATRPLAAPSEVTRSSPAAAAPSKPATPVAVPSAAATPAGGGTSPEPSPVGSPPVPRPFTGPAATRFGANRVAAAYQTATALELLTTVHEPVIGERTPTLGDVSLADHYLDAAGQAMLVGGVRDQATSYDLADLFFYGLGSGKGLGGYAIRTPDADRYHAGYATTGVVARTGQPDELAIRFPVGGNLLAVKAGADYKIPFSKNCTLYMVEDPTGPDGWLVDSWSAKYDVGTPEPDTTP